MNQVSAICVCGAGTMGSGIAQVMAAAGYYTILYELNGEVLAKAKTGIEQSLSKLAAKNRITEEEKENTLQRIRFTQDLHECMADVVIEAIIEKTETKIALLNQLAEINHSETIFATNTSSLSVTQIAAGVKNPERVIGMHFFNPAPLMKLVEVVKTTFTNDITIETITRLAKHAGKIPVLCKDAPGFIVNHVARPFYTESLRLVEAGYADFSTIDDLVEATGFRMGPFRLMDLIGNDINYTVSCSVYEQLGKPERLKPSYLQKEKVEQGRLGRKTGGGYYDYTL